MTIYSLVAPRDHVHAPLDVAYGALVVLEHGGLATAHETFLVQHELSHNQFEIDTM